MKSAVTAASSPSCSACTHNAPPPPPPNTRTNRPQRRTPTPTPTHTYTHTRTHTQASATHTPLHTHTHLHTHLHTHTYTHLHTRTPERRPHARVPPARPAPPARRPQQSRPAAEGSPALQRRPMRAAPLAVCRCAAARPLPFPQTTTRPRCSAALARIGAQRFAYLTTDASLCIPSGGPRPVQPSRPSARPPSRRPGMAPSANVGRGRHLREQAEARRRVELHPRLALLRRRHLRAPRVTPAAFPTHPRALRAGRSAPPRRQWAGSAHTWNGHQLATISQRNCRAPASYQ